MAARDNKTPLYQYDRSCRSFLHFNIITTHIQWHFFNVYQVENASDSYILRPTLSNADKTLPRYKNKFCRERYTESQFYHRFMFKSNRIKCFMIL